MVVGSKIIRTYKRRAAAKIKNTPLMPILILGVLIASFVVMNNSKRFSVIPASYRPLLNLIADVESRGNYNAYFGNVNNSSINFTDMTVAEVMEWQKNHAATGAPSTAVGRYQIIDSTLAELVDEMDVEANQLFDETTQDKMAVALLERRGSVSYVNKEMSRYDFAANLAKEWASLPKVTGNNPDHSYYAGDGLNKSLVGKEKVLRAIDAIESKKPD